MKGARAILFTLLLIASLLVVGCGDDDDDSGNDDDSTVDDDDDDNNDTPGLTRSFALAGAPVQFIVTESSVHTGFVFDGFDDRVDIISLHMDNFFGLPWEAFVSQTDPPATWLAVMEQIQAEVEALGVEVYLSVTPISGLRERIGANATEKHGNLVVDDEWLPGCYDFDTGPSADDYRQAYLRFVRWMVDAFDPVYLTHGIEVDLYEGNCPDQFESLIGLLNEAYAQEKALNPDLPIFPTFTAANMWSYGDGGGCQIGDSTCLLANLEKMSTLQRDRFGISSYPSFLSWEWEAVPKEFYTAFSELTGERPVFGEIGWGSYPVIAPYPTLEDDCMLILDSSDAMQIEFMEFLFEVADEMDADFLVWWSLRDYLPEPVLTSCPCSAPGIWCVLYEAFYDIGLLPAWLMWGSMGVIDYDGNLKPSYAIWYDWLNRPIR